MRHFALLTLLLVALTARAQPTEVAVPDLTGATPPVAAAVLASYGLVLGDERIIAVDPASNDPENTIAGQSPAAGALAAPGTAVDIDVLRLVNARLLYDDNDLTLLNLTSEPLDLRDVSFVAIEGDPPAAFEAARWTNTLPVDQCTQLWSLARATSKPVDGCGLVIWRTDSRPESHFWTHTAGVARFSVEQGGETRAVCDAAGPGTQDNPLRCDIVFEQARAGEISGYTYFAYTPDAFVVHNQTEDRWMALDTAVVEGRGPLLAIAPDTPARLAPGHCLLLASSPDVQQPVPCVLVSRATIAPSQRFWKNDFRIAGSDGLPRTCEAAADGVLSICILPR
jgi:hypothetical protein